MVSETRGFKRGDEDAKNRLKDLAEVVKKLERDGLNPEEAIEKVLNDILDLDKLKDHVRDCEHDDF
jgi:ribosome-binding protein aMBF1 (putative translation factor)